MNTTLIVNHWATKMEQGYTTMSSACASDNVFVNINGLVATYTNQDNSHDNINSYLTPSSPITPQPPRILPPSRNVFPPPRKQPIGEAVQRVDSGIETDSQRSPTPSTSTTNPRNSVAVYEYINPKDVYLEPHPSVRSRYGPGESLSSASTNAPLAYVRDVMSDSEDVIAGFEDPSRRRFNPMYEALEKSATRLYAQTCHCKIQASTQKQIRCLWCALIFLIIIMIFSLGVMAYVLFFLVPSIQVRVVFQEEQIRDLQSQSDPPRQTRNGNVIQMPVKNNTVEPRVREMLGAIAQLNMSVNGLTSQLFAMNASFQDQILNISLTPGPEGPAGAGDLNRCYYQNRSSNQRLPGQYSTTSWQPEINVLEDYTVMSVACGVVGGTQQFVESNAVTIHKVQYRCRCDGEVSGYTLRECRIHLVLCPRSS